MSTEIETPNYTDIRAYKQEDHDQWVVTAGDYADEPDLVVYVDHAVDENGQDVSAAVAAQIVRALAGGAA